MRGAASSVPSATTQGPTAGPDQSGAYHCDVYLVLTLCVEEDGVVIPGTCTSYIIGCESGHVVPEENEDEPGGGGGIGGSDDNPCTPCEQDPDGPQVPCSSGGGPPIGSSSEIGDPPTGCEAPPPDDPCDFDNPPAYCSEPDPCQQADSLENNAAFKTKMNILQNNAQNKNYETGYLLYSLSGGGYSYNYDEGTPNEPEMSLTPTLNIDGYIHSHYSGTYSTFSGQDIRAIYQIFQAGKIDNLNTFTAGVVSSQGTTYLIKIEDPQAFLNFSQENLKNQSTFESLEEFYNNWFNTYTDVLQKSETKARELALLKTIEDSGLKFFEGNTNFNDWNAIKNKNATTVNDNCK